MQRSRLGKWAGGLSAAFVALLTALILGIAFRKLLPGTPLAIAVGECALAFGLASFIAGIVSLARFKDRSFYVIGAIVLGSISIILFGMETLDVIGGGG